MKLNRVLVCVALAVLILGGLGVYKDVAPSYERIGIDLNLNDNQLSYCCYSDEEVLIFSVGSRTGATVGPLVNTEELRVINHRDTSNKKIYDINSDAYVVSSIPYENGLLYIDYTVGKTCLNWELIFSDGSEKILIDSGEAIDFYHIPKLCIIKNTPIYIYEYKESGEDAYAVKMIDKFENSMIYSEKNPLVTVEIASNGKEVCYITEDKKSDEVIFNVLDLSGLRTKVVIEDKITSFGISSKYAVCGTGNDNKEFAIQAISLKDYSEKKIQVDRPLYRMSKTNSNYLLCVDSGWKYFMLDVEKENLKEISKPEGLTEDEWCVIFQSASENELIFECGTDSEKYFYCKWI